MLHEDSQVQIASATNSELDGESGIASKGDREARSLSRWPSYQILGWALVALSFSCLLASPGVAAAAERQAKTIKLVIAYEKGFEKCYSEIPWTAGMTVLDAMRIVEKHPQPTRFKFRGKGETTFLTQIDDVENQGARGDNWIYRINGKLGDRSFAIQKLESSDTILWSFGRYQ